MSDFGIFNPVNLFQSCGIELIRQQPTLLRPTKETNTSGVQQEFFNSIRRQVIRTPRPRKEHGRCYGIAGLWPLGPASSGRIIPVRMRNLPAVTTSGSSSWRAIVWSRSRPVRSSTAVTIRPTATLLTKWQPREHRTHTPSNRIRPCGESLPRSNSNRYGWLPARGAVQLRKSDPAMSSGFRPATGAARGQPSASAGPANR